MTFSGHGRKRGECRCKILITSKLHAFLDSHAQAHPRRGINPRASRPFLIKQMKQRFTAGRMSDQAFEPKVIAAALGLDDQTVRRWLREYRGAA